MNKVIGIEGLVGSGKTSICRELLKEIPNSILLNGGNLYRAIVYAFMKLNKENTNVSDLKENFKNADVKDIMDKLGVRIELENMETVIYIGDKKIEEEELQSKDSSLAVSVASNVADNSKLFIFGKQIIDGFKDKFNVIVSGRALMQIYPDLDYHFLITASLDERVRRKYIQYKEKISKEEVRRNIIQRDELQEKSGFYKKYDKTILIDVTDCKTIQESTKKVLEKIKY